MKPLLRETTIAKLAEKLRKVREKKGLTQADVAGKAGITVNYYARVERGEVNPSFETIGQITKSLGVKSSEILPF